jgi:hypothetical protein
MKLQARRPWLTYTMNDQLRGPPLAYELRGFDVSAFELPPMHKSVAIVHLDRQAESQRIDPHFMRLIGSPDRRDQV